VTWVSGLNHLPAKKTIRHKPGPRVQIPPSLPLYKYMMQFVKLNKKFNVGNFTETSLINAYAINGKGIEFYNVDDYDKELILSVIPERFRHEFIIREMKINHSIPPHTDSYITATINFYVKTSNCKTEFFKKVDAAEGVKMTTQTTGRTFDANKLEPTDSFIAEDDDVWLLDVSSPHSIKSLSTTPVDRIAISLQSPKYDFSQLYEMLRETGYI